MTKAEDENKTEVSGWRFIWVPEKMGDNGDRRLNKNTTRRNQTVGQRGLYEA